MKKLLFAWAFAAAVLCFGAGPSLPFSIDPKIPRKIDVGKKPVLTLTPGNFDVVAGRDIPAVKLAAKEIADALSEVFGTPVKPVTKGTGKAVEILVGDLEFARKLGVDPGKFDRDGFVIRTDGNKILIIGRDLPGSAPLRSAGKIGLKGEWATLFGAYDFLERFAGVRYYFPGKLGTCIPKAKELAIPEVDIYDRPDFLQRRFNDWNYSGPIRRYPGWNGALNRLRNRSETLQIPNCHGLAYLGYYYRFKDTHPEYFGLNANGKHMFRLRDGRDDSHLCYSSGIREEIVKDAVSFLKGEPASVRGIRNERGNAAYAYLFPAGLPCFNIMPNDGAYLCRCPACWKHFSKGPQATTDHYWQFFSDICEGVKKSGVPGFLTTMAYGDYRPIPTQRIPDNLLVMLAMRGPWNEYRPAVQEKDVELLKAWNAKLGQKTWLWTYPGKYYGLMQGIPHSTPRAIGSFIKRVRPYIFGLYIGCDSDVVLFNYLNYHVLGKLSWNTDTDVEKLLDDHARSLFGPAANPMKEFFDSVEKHWARIAAYVVETAEGPKIIYPSELTLWNEIYSPAEIKRLKGLFDQAGKLAGKDELVLERISFIRREFFGPLLAEAEKFAKVNDAVRMWRFAFPEFKGKGAPSEKEWAAAPAFHLAGLGGKAAEVPTLARAMYDAENFYFRFECGEKETEKIRAFKRPYDQGRGDVWEDSDVEIFISPDGDRKHLYQLLVNSLGSWADLEITEGVHNYKWNSNAKVSAKIIPGKGWQADIVLPRSSMRKAALEGILVNFSRHRVMKGVEVKTPYYCWSPFARNFSDVSRFGALLFKPEAGKNLLINPDFAPARMKGRWHMNKQSSLDRRYFLTEGCSVKLRCGDAVTSELFQYFKGVKPDTDYEVSFFLRMDKVKKKESTWSGFYVRFDHSNGTSVNYPPYSVQLEGTCPWTGFSFRVHTPKDFNAKKKAYINFILRKAEGVAWVDHVQLREAGK